MNDKNETPIPVRKRSIPFHRHLPKDATVQIKVDIKFWGRFTIPVDKGRQLAINNELGILYLRVKNGVYVLPKDGTYIRFVNNSWYD